MNLEIIPACMPKSFDDIYNTTELVINYVDTIQIDIMDGKYVPERTWPFLVKKDNYFNNLIDEKKGLPFWDRINYEFDLMVHRPELNLGVWIKLGASRIIFHYQSVHNWDLISNIEESIRNFIEIGVAVTIHDNIENIYRLIENNIVDFVQVMGISRIGYMGEPFNAKSFNIIEKLRKKYPNLIISVDGGVSSSNLTKLKQLGVNRAVSGSGIFGGGIVADNIKFLQKISSDK